jgi:hypothetical protein
MEMEFTSAKEAEKTNTPFFEFTEDHPFHSTDAVVYRIQKGKQDCVPVFSWSFIGSTRGFERSMMENVSLTDPQYQKKEEYAQRFMIVFLPFRKKEDLIEDGSFQRAFQTAYKEGKFSDEMIAIANNIQAIQNSIESGIPENGLSSRTVLPDAEEFDLRNGEEEEMGYEDLLSTIGDMLSPVPEGVPLEADATRLDPDFSGKQLQGPQFRPEEETEEEKEKEDQELCSVIQLPNDVDDAASDTDIQDDPLPMPFRFRTETSELNSLLLRQENVLNSEEVADEMEGDSVMAADACGSWQSNVNWGKRNKLDAEQEVAFEVLTATYVLTFNDEAKDNLDDQAAAEFIKNKNRLLELARRNPRQTTNKPLRMFVTGPAGAGKCKQQYYSVLLVTIVSDDANQSILFSQIIRGGSCLCKTLQSKYQPSFQQADNSCYSNDRSSCYGDRWSNNSFGIPLHAKQKLCYAR